MRRGTTGTVLLLAVVAALGWWWASRERAEIAPPVPAGIEASDLDRSPGDVADPQLRSGAALPTVPPETPVPTAAQEGLRVRVRTVSGQALVGVPIVLEVTPRVNPAYRRAVGRADTGADGIAVLSLETWRQRTKLPPHSTSELTLEVACAWPLDPRVAVELTEAPAPGAILELVLPDAASQGRQDVAVLVVDEADRPLEGVRVQLAEVSLTTSSSDQVRERALTDAAGRVTLPLRKVWERTGRMRAAGISLKYVVSCDLPLREIPRAVLDERAREEGIRLVVPATGTVEIALLDHEGRGVTTAGSIALFWRDPEAATADTRWKRTHDGTLLTTEGRATFAYVGLDLELMATGSVPDGSSAANSLKFPGPTRAAETTTVSLELGAPRPWMVGRLVDQDGEPLSHHRVVMEDWFDPEQPPSVHSGPPRPFWLVVTTDESGRFRFQVATERRGAGRRHLRFLEKTSPGGTFLPDGRWARCDIPRELATGSERDLGDVVLTEIPVLVAGRALGEDWQPVGRVQVSLAHPYGPADGRKWANVHRVRSDKTGYFEIRHPGGWDVVRVWGRRSPHYSGQSDDLIPGTRDVILLLEDDRKRREKLGSIEGRLLLDEGIPFYEVHVVIESGGVRRDKEVGPGGGFALPDAQPGTATLEARTQHTDWLLARLEGVEVRTGETATDARLQAWDVRGRARLLRLKILTESGKPIVGTRIWAVDSRGKGGTTRTDAEGWLQLYVPTAPATYALRCPEFGDAEVDGDAPEGTEVTLRP